MAGPKNPLPRRNRQAQYSEHSSGLPFAERGFSCSDFTRFPVAVVLHAAPSVLPSVVGRLASPLIELIHRHGSAGLHAKPCMSPAP